MRNSLALLLLLDVLTQSSSWGQTNILNNGGFESGLMCYSEWMWSQTGVDFAGDYQFQLSTDSHSGNYSFKINCGGSDCLRAAIYSDNISAAANQSYKMNLWAKCPSGTSAAVYIPGMANGGVTQYLNCNGNWTSNQVAFQNGPAANYWYYYIFLFGTPWLEVDDVVLTYGDGSVPQTIVQHPGVANVKISGQTVLLNNKPFFSRGFFNVPYSDLAQVAATGANTINGLATYNAANCFNTGQKTYLDTVYDLGMHFAPDSSTTARLGVPAVYPNTIQTFAPHLANVAWFLADEPDLQAVSWEYIQPSTFVAESSAAKTQTPLPMMADFQTAAYAPASSVAPYNGSADIWMAEPYGSDFSSSTYAINLFNSIQQRPIWLAQDAIDASLIVPKAYWVVIGGATGIQYFSWDEFKADSTKLAAAEQVFKELKGLEGAIFGDKIDSLVTPPAGIASAARYDSSNDSTYILSVNSSSGAVQGNFQVPGLPAGQKITVVYENRTITSGAGGFSDTFTGVSRHVYQIPSPSTSLSAALVSESGPVASRDWKLQVSNTGIGDARSAQVKSVTLSHIGGTNCSPKVGSKELPVQLGDILPGANAMGNVLIDFTGCDSTSLFKAAITVTADKGAVTSTLTLNNQPM